METFEDIIALAERRFHNDPLFHARAVRSVEAIGTRIAGAQLTPEDRSLALLAAAVGMVMAELPASAVGGSIGAARQAIDQLDSGAYI